MKEEGEFDEDNILANYKEPDINIEYMFIEKAPEQVKVINDDQAYMYLHYAIMLNGKFSNDNVERVRKDILEELNYCVKTYDYFTSEKIDLGEYKLGIVDDDMNIAEHDAFDDHFYEALKASTRNFAIYGRNFDIHAFTHHDIFTKWFEKYTNR
jgi:hypothetical protein